VTPIDRGAEGPLASRGVARSRGEQREAVAEPLEDLRRRQDLDPRRGELDRQGKTVEPPADLAHCGVGLELGIHRQGACGEERDGVAVWQRGNRILPLRGDAQRFAARDQELHRCRCVEQPCDARRRVDHLFEVVDGEQHAFRRQVVREVGGDTYRLSDRRLDQLGIGDRRERAPEDTVDVLVGCVGRDLHGQPRLACAAWADERHQAVLAKERRRLLELSFATHEWGLLDREVGEVERAQRWELGAPDLIEAHRC
jgi:hypothetical protein